MSLEQHIAVVDENFRVGMPRSGARQRLDWLGVDWFPSNSSNPIASEVASLYPPKLFLMWTPQAAELRFDESNRLSEVWLDVRRSPAGVSELVKRAGLLDPSRAPEGVVVVEEEVRMIRIQPLPARLQSQIASEGRR